MVLPSIDNFLKILRFYQLNSIKDVKDLNKRLYQYNTIDKFYNSLNYNYEQGSEGLKYPENQKQIEYSINARLDLANYLNNVGFPGSYAYNTPDGYLIKQLILDWASVIKTFQDSTEKVTNAYLLSSEEVDKAIRGFGIDFINSATVPSLDRRQTYLLKMCELYKIKGTPDSIINALNIIGLDDIYIQECWIYPTRDGQKNIEIKWIPVYQQQTFNNIKNSYEDPNTDLETEYWTWDKFYKEINKQAGGIIDDPHWFYYKDEIIKLNWNDEEVLKYKETFIHLPSITPYFNVKIKFDTDSQACQLSKIYEKLKEQINIYLNNIDLPKECRYDGYGTQLSFLDIWCTFMYVLALYWDFINFYSLQKYIKKFGVFDINYEDFIGNTKYFDLIYKIYTVINDSNLDKNIQKSYQSILDFYVPVASPLSDLSYNYIKYWWISNKHLEDDDKNGLTDIKNVIYPSKILATTNQDYVEIYWNENYNYGYYDVEIFVEGKWVSIEKNSQVKCEAMQRIICISYNGKNIDYENIENLYDKIRIIHFRTENNIPDVFFRKPFYVSYFNRNTDMDMILGFNDKILHDTIFQKELFHALYENQNANIEGNYTKEDLYKNALELIRNKKIRITDRDLLYKIYCNSLFQYPKSILKEDRNYIFNNSFFRYIIEPTYNYVNFIEHEGEKLNYYNIGNRYPQNSKWNWAVSYGLDKSTSYYYINYETLRWCRIKSGELICNKELDIESNGIPFYKDKKIYIKVCENDKDKNYFVIDDQNCLVEENWNALCYVKKQYPYNTIIKTFVDECKCDYTIENDKINLVVPPSDIYPSCVIEDVMYDHKRGSKYFTFSDGLIKPDSKLAKDIVVCKIDLRTCELIYENVLDCDNSARYDNNTSNDIQASTIITLYKDPFGKNEKVKYNYYEFLNYMYINGFSLDRNSGYIYKKINYYLDDNNYLYIKCINLDNKKYSDIINYKWVRVKVSRQWKNNEDRKSIYYEIDSDNNYVLDIDGKRVSNYMGSKYNYELTFNNYYDAKRYLSDYCVKNNDFSELPDDCNKVLCLYNGINCYVKYDTFTDEKYKYVKEKDIIKYDNNHVKLNYGAKLNSPLIKEVNFGINQDFLDYINSLFTTYGISPKQYEEVIIQLSEIINDYTSKNFGINTKLDIYNSHIFKSRLIKNIINFYKPKRDRILKITSQIEVDDKDYVFGDGTNDLNYNKLDYTVNCSYGKEKYNERENGGVSNQLQVVKQEINDYVPFNDLIYIDKQKSKTEVNSCREIYPYENSNIENLVVWDKVLNCRDFKNTIKNETVYPSFYCSSFENNINGFYYKNNENYYLNNYLFTVKNFVFTSIYDKHGNKNKDGQRLLINIKCWCIITKSLIDTQLPYKCLYVSTENITENPYIDKNGQEMKYQKVSADNNDSFVLKYAKSEFNYGIFQIPKYGEKGEYDNSYIKSNLRVLEPCFYVSNFDDEKYNGFYYTDNQFRFDMPVYKNKNGKMISYFDLSYLPNNYLDFCIKEYHRNNCNTYWIATDYKEIPDIFEAKYIAYCDNDKSIFEYKDGVQTGKTNTFYKCKINHDNYKSDLLFLSGVYGWTIQELYGHPEYISKVDYLNKNFKYENVILDDSDIESNVHYGDKLVDRRISQNIIPEKYTPISYINFNFGAGLIDRYKNKDTDKYVTQCYIRNESGEKQKLYKDLYTYDYNFNKLGAIKVDKDQSITFFDLVPLDKKTVVVRYRKNSGEDILWHTYIYKIVDSKYDLYVDDQLVIGESKPAMYGLTINGDCTVCEYAIFNEIIPEWYYPIIREYGVFRFRKEPTKEYNNNNHKNYTPLFCTEMPRTIFGKFMTGLPESIEGDRVNSKYVDYMGNTYIKHYGTSQINEDDLNYSCEKFTKTYGIEIRNTLDGYKWNAQCRYFPNKPSEISSLWSKKVASRIYDRVIETNDNTATIYKRGNGLTKYINIDGERLYIDPLYDVSDKKFYNSEREKSLFVDGLEMKVPSNYILNDDIPLWWTGKREDYKSGVVDHRPLYIATKQKIDDPYPTIKHGKRCCDYMDQDQMFDGSGNGNPQIYFTSEFDDNTKYLNTTDTFEKNACESKVDVNVFGAKMEFNSGTDYCCPCNNTINCTSIYDPDTVHLTKEMKDNLIYHKTLILDKNSKFLLDVSGEYNVSDNIPYKNEFDMDYCYCSIKSTKNFDKFYNIIKENIKDKRWNNGKKSDGVIKLMSHDVAVPCYNITSNHYLWEVRRIDYYLINEKYYNDIHYTYDMVVCYSKKLFKLFNLDVKKTYLVDELIYEFNILIDKINNIKLTKQKYQDMRVLNKVQYFDELYKEFSYLVSYFGIIDKWVVFDEIDYYVKKILLIFDMKFEDNMDVKTMIHKMNIVVNKALNMKKYSSIHDDLYKIKEMDDLYHITCVLSVFNEIYEPFQYIRKTDIIGYNGDNTFNYLYCIKQRKVLTNFIKDRRIRSNKNNEYDFINRLQLDICCQPLCTYLKDPKDFLSTNYYSYLKQNIVSKVGFRNYSTIRLIPKSELKIIDNASYDVYYLDGEDLYVNINGKSYGPFKLSNNRKIPHQLREHMICNINSVYTKKRCYLKVQNNRWMPIEFERGFIEEYNSMYKPFYVNNNVYVNIPYTDPLLPYWSYYVDEKEIMATILRFKELNNLGTSQYDHYGEEFPEDKMDEFYLSYLNKQTITDDLYLQFQQICALDSDKICLKKKKDNTELQKYFGKLIAVDAKNAIIKENL